MSANNKVEENKNKKPKKDDVVLRQGNDWYGFGIQIIKNLIYTLIFGLMGANFIFYYKVLDFDDDENSSNGNKKEDKYFPIKRMFYNKDFLIEEKGGSGEGDVNATGVGEQEEVKGEQNITKEEQKELDDFSLEHQDTEKNNQDRTPTRVGGKDYKCENKGRSVKDTKVEEDDKPSFPYNLYTKPQEKCSDENVCEKMKFTTWWKNVFSYSIFKTNQSIRKFTRDRFKNKGEYSMLTSDTSFYLLFVFYFMGGLMFSSCSGFIYLFTVLLGIDSTEIESISGTIWGVWDTKWWLLFNLLCFGIIFTIMFVFGIVTVIQYIINFTIKPIMHDQADIKEILKCNVHTLILFFCLLTVSSSSEYLDDVSAMVMSVVTGLYFIRTAIIYVKG